jgi:hypothetical protein
MGAISYIVPMLMKALLSEAAANTAFEAAAKKAFSEAKSYLAIESEDSPDVSPVDLVSQKLEAIETTEGGQRAAVQSAGTIHIIVERLETTRDEQERHARNFHNVAFIILLGGAIIFLIGLALMVFAHFQLVGGIASVGGAISAFASAAPFKFAKDASDNLAATGDSLQSLLAAQFALDAIGHMESKAERDAAIHEVARNVLQVQAHSAKRGKSNRS